MRTPPGTRTRLGLAPRGPAFVFLAPMPIEPGMHLLQQRPGSLTVLLTHDLGATWPDRRGELLVKEALALGEAAVLQFASLEDALAAQRRLQAVLAGC